MIDEVGFLPVDTRQMFPQIDIIILGVCGTACPNPPPPPKKKKHTHTPKVNLPTPTK